MTRAFISLGSNLGDREKNIFRAAEELGKAEGIRVIRMSRLYETDPVGNVNQPRFLNSVAEIDAGGTPEGLLDRLLSIESGLGRIRSERWGPRVIDLDLLLFGTQRVETPRLVVPHPRMAERRFVLEPLAELAPDLVIPGDDCTVLQRLNRLSREN